MMTYDLVSLEFQRVVGTVEYGSLRCKWKLEMRLLVEMLSEWKALVFWVRVNAPPSERLTLQPVASERTGGRQLPPQSTAAAKTDLALA